MRVVITGGAGFVGSHLAEHLLGAGHAVLLIDDLSTGRRENVEHLLGDRCELRISRVGELPADASWLDGVDQVYHLAAAVGVKLIVDQPVASIENNVLETAAVLRAVAGRGVPTLVTSSSEVYGKSTRVPFRETDDVVYGPTIYSRWSYAMAKALDEQLALAHHAARGLPVVIVRLFNTVGPRQVGEYGMVIPRFIQKALADEPIEVYGDGRQTRCFVHVRDVAAALPKLLGDTACHGSVYNLGGSDEVTIERLARRVIERSGSRSQVVHVPYDQAYQTRFDDLRRRVPDLGRVQEAIGFAPTASLDEMIDELIASGRG